MALRSRLISDPNEVLRIIDDMGDSDLSSENDSENDEELQEADISLVDVDVDVVTPVHSDSESVSIDPIASGSVGGFHSCSFCY